MGTNWKYAVVAAVAFMAGIALAATWASAHGGDTKLVHACVDHRTGQVRIAFPGGPTNNPSFVCPNGYDTLDWNIQGPKGEQGTPAAGGGGLLVSSCASDAGGVRYFVPSGGTGEANNQFAIPSTGKFLSLAVNPISNSYDVGATLVTLQVNGANTALQVSIPAGSRAVVTVAGEVPVVAGDLVRLSVDSRAANFGGVGQCYATFEFRSN